MALWRLLTLLLLLLLSHYAAVPAEKVFILLALLSAQIHAFGMEPFAAKVAVDVHQVGVERLQTDAEFLPGAVRRVQSLRQRAVGRPREVRRVDVDGLELVVLLDLVDLAFADDGVGEDFVAVSGREDFVVANVLDVVVCDAELLHVEVLLPVVPLHEDHRLAGLLLAAAFLDDPQDPTHNRALLRFAEECKLSNAVNDAAEHELAVDRRLGSLSAQNNIDRLVTSKSLERHD